MIVTSTSTGPGDLPGMAHNAASSLMNFSPYQSSTTVRAREGLVGAKKYNKRNQLVPTMPYLEVQCAPAGDVSWCLLWGSCICTYERDPQDEFRFSVGAGLALYRPTYKEIILDTINSICEKMIYKKPFDIREDILYYQGNPLLSDCTIHHYAGQMPSRSHIMAWTTGFVDDSPDPLPDKSNP